MMHLDELGVNGLSAGPVGRNQRSGAVPATAMQRVPPSRFGHLLSHLWIGYGHQG